MIKNTAQFVLVEPHQMAERRCLRTLVQTQRTAAKSA